MKRVPVVMVGVVMLFLAATVAAVDVKISRIQSAEGFLRGTLENVAVDPLGTLSLAPRSEKVATIEEPFVLAAAATANGWVVGTGSDGKVLAVSAKGRIETLLEVAGEQIFAVAVAADGTVWAGASPSGKVWRIVNGTSELVAEVGETYIWSLAPLPDGSVWVGTGPRGRLLRIDAKGRVAVVWDGHDPHVRVVRALPEGGVVLGTAGSGLVVRVDQAGRPTTLFDAVHPEIVDVLPAPEGGFFVAAIASEASQVNLRPTKSSEDSKAEGEEGEGVTVTPMGEGEGPIGSRPPGFQGARSEVLLVGPRGGATVIAALPDQTVLALALSNGRLWVGTGLEGKVYSVRGERLVLEHDNDERQVVALVGRADGAPTLVTTNGGSVVRLDDGGKRQGVYTAPVLDAGQVARFGVLRWRGERPQGSRIRVSARSGMSAEPGPDWSPWTAASEAQEVSLVDLAEGRYVQVRAQLEGEQGASPTVGSLELSWRQLNQRPRVESFEALASGEILVPFGFNPGNQVYEASSPTRDGIFTSLTPATEGDDGRLKTVYKRGFQTFRWKASDPNGDDLRSRLDIRREGSEGRWFSLVEDRVEGYFAFDSTVLPDGIWRVRLTVSDARSGAPGEALEATAMSEPLVLDQTPPRAKVTRRDQGRIEVEVVDSLNPIREAVYSVDAKNWTKATALDGLVDGRTETLVIDPIPEGAELLLLRVTDAAFNSTVIDLGSVLP